MALLSWVESLWDKVTGPNMVTPEEIEVVFAHEVGHHVHRHMLKMVVWSVFLAAASFWLADFVLRHTAERWSSQRHYGAGRWSLTFDAWLGRDLTCPVRAQTHPCPAAIRPAEDADLRGYST